MFIVFIVTYLLWVAISSILTNKAMPSIIAGKNFLFTQAQILIQLVFFFLFIYLISGFFKAELVGLFLIGSELGVILSSIIVGFVGSLNTPWAAHGVWAGGEFGLKNRWIMLVIMLLSFAIVVVYPILIYQIPGEELLIQAIRYTTILFISGYIILAPVLIGALKSENLDEDTRKRYLTAQLSGVIPTTMYLSLLFWAFGFSKAGIALPQVAGISLFLSPALLIVLFLFFFTFIILPYLIGAIRAKKWKIQLLGKRSGYLAEILEILDYPTSSTYITEVMALNRQIGIELNQLAADDIMIYYGHQIDMNMVPKEIANVEKPYRLARNMDPRFKYIDWLVDFAVRTNQLVDDLKIAGTDEELKEKAKSWKIPLHKAKHDLDAEIENAGKTKGPLMITAVMSMVTLLVSALMSDLGKWFFERMTK
ncbi:MAG: hypothetical protein WCP08_00820 [Prolixibacteraceae bacterium]